MNSVTRILSRLIPTSRKQTIKGKLAEQRARLDNEAAKEEARLQAALAYCLD